MTRHYLSPCPKCRGAVELREVDAGIVRFWVGLCPKCGTIGPGRLTESAAASAWGAFADGWYACVDAGLPAREESGG